MLQSFDQIDCAVEVVLSDFDDHHDLDCLEDPVAVHALQYLLSLHQGLLEFF